MKKKIKKIKLFFLAFLSVCFWLTSFSSAFNISSEWIDYLNSISLNSWSFTNANLPLLYDIPNPSSDDIRNLCVVFKNFDRSSDFAWGFRYADSVGNSSLAPLYATTSPYSLYCVSWRRGKFFITYNNTSNRVSAEKFWVFDSYNIWGLFWLTWSSVDCSQDANYRQCLEDKNILIWQVSTLSGDLNTCNISLSSCLNGVDVSYQACIENLSWCQSDLTNMTNYNDSLSSQLQECLESWWSWSSDLICNTFDLFWDSDNTRYSFPINNNLILPAWYKGFVNEWVLAIKQDNNNAYSISDEDFQNVMDSYWVVFLYLFGWALFLMFLFIMRKYFIWLKS